MTMSTPVSLLITDLDNTLFDWFETWHASFTAMLRRTAEISGVPVETLEAEWKSVHQRHGTSEYAYALEELPSLRARHPQTEIRSTYNDAVEAYREARAQTLRLYP